MLHYKKYDNGLRLVVNKMEGMLTVSCGVMVKTGSANEIAENNGISHFIEHCMFKGTKKRSAFEISDHIDRIGGQINAYTAKEATCYYTKATSEHLENTLEVLSDIFFNSVFDEKEIEKEKSVVIEEINMCEDSPEDVCLDLLAKSYYGDKGLGQTILGEASNIKSFTRENLLEYIKKYYTPDNVVVSIAGNVDLKSAESLVFEYFANKFEVGGGCNKFVQFTPKGSGNLIKFKDIEQAHVGLSLPTFSMFDEKTDSLSIANIVFGGGMSSRLFQKIREEMGLCYNVYSFASHYIDSGVLEIYGAVNVESRDKSVDAIISEINKFRKDGLTENEFARGKQQMKSSFIMGQESTVSQMLLQARYLLYLNKKFNFNERIEQIDKIKIDDVNEIISKVFDVDKLSVATVGKNKNPIKI